MSLSLAVAIVAGSPVPSSALDPDFGHSTATSKFLTGVTFELNLDEPIAAGTKVEILVDNNRSDETFVSHVPTEAGEVRIRSELDMPSGSVIPGTIFTAHWRLTPTGGQPVVGAPVTIVYADDRFDWQTVTGDVVRMHWYDGDAAFGRQALAIAEDAISRNAELLGVEDLEPVDFYIYADVEPFRDAIGPASRENVGGVAYEGAQTMLARISPSGINEAWIRTVIPHELMHIVFGSAIENPYHSPPKWLDEGLAVYESEGYAAVRRAAVEEAVGRGTLMPLSALVGQFPTSLEGFLLGYGESVSAVDFLVRTYGHDKLVNLVRSYSAGVSDDDAFETALGVDVAGFEAAWLADLGASAPEAYGPQPAPPGPLPSGWEAGPTPLPSASPGASASTEPTPAASPAPNDRSDSSSGAVVVVAGLLVVLALAGGGLWWRRRATLRR